MALAWKGSSLGDSTELRMIDLAETLPTLALDDLEEANGGISGSALDVYLTQNPGTGVIGAAPPIYTGFGQPGFPGIGQPLLPGYANGYANGLTPTYIQPA